MRDLTIWVMALRLASRNGGALLLSRDKVHTHERGDNEASSANLVRVRSIEEALEFLDVETPSGKLVGELLDTVWTDLRDAGIPLAPEFSLTGVSETRFIQGDYGPSLASFVFRTRTPNGETVTAVTRVDAVDGIITEVTLSEITVEGKAWQGKPLPLVVSTSKALRLEPDDFQERLGALKAVM